jgi:putative transposase
MPRPPRIIVPGIPHHITQRSNHQKSLFTSNNDHNLYLAILKKQCDRTGLSVLGYCLMPNHIHLIAIPPDANSIASAIGQAQRRFSMEMNRRKKLTGHIWERRYFSSPMDDAHLVRSLIYVDQNPVRAGLVSKSTDWPWSSAVAHTGRIDPGELVNQEEWRKWSKKMGWDDLVKQEQDVEEIGMIERHVQTGRPMGGEPFLQKIESKLGHGVRRNAGPGRPKKML